VGASTMRLRWSSGKETETAVAAAPCAGGNSMMMAGAHHADPEAPAHHRPAKPACFIGPGAPAPLVGAPGVFARARRPNTWDFKTRRPAWDGLRSRWRFIEGLTFWMGPPSHLVSRVWPAMALNLLGGVG